MDIQGFASLLKLFLKQFIIYYLVILLGEWFAEKKGYNLFERAWLITVIALSILMFLVWARIIKDLRFL